MNSGIGSGHSVGGHSCTRSRGGESRTNSRNERVDVGNSSGCHGYHTPAATITDRINSIMYNSIMGVESSGRLIQRTTGKEIAPAPCATNTIGLWEEQEEQEEQQEGAHPTASTPFYGTYFNTADDSGYLDSSGGHAAADAGMAVNASMATMYASELQSPHRGNQSQRSAFASGESMGMGSGMEIGKVTAVSPKVAVSFGEYPVPVSSSTPSHNHRHRHRRSVRVRSTARASTLSDGDGGSSAASRQITHHNDRNYLLSRRSASHDLTAKYDSNGYFDLRDSSGNARPKKVEPKVAADGNAYMKIQRKLAGLMHLFSESDLSDEHCGSGIGNGAGSGGSAGGGSGGSGIRHPRGLLATEGPRLVGTAELLAEQHQRYIATDGADPLPPKPRWYDTDGHTANSTIVQLNDRVYWSENKATMVGESHRQVFESSIGAIYNRMHVDYPA